MERHWKHLKNLEGIYQRSDGLRIYRQKYTYGDDFYWHICPCHNKIQYFFAKPSLYSLEEIMEWCDGNFGPGQSMAYDWYSRYWTSYSSLEIKSFKKSCDFDFFSFSD